MDYIAFSGGIDSTALALVMPKAQPVFTDTGWEFDELYTHIERFEQVTGREVLKIKESLPAIIERKKYLPNHNARFCTELSKIKPLNKFLAGNLPATLMIGLRADEDRTGNLTEMEGLTIRYPLQEMGLNRLACVQTCLKYDLLPRYPVYMARGGCKGCFYKRKSEVLAMIALVPEVVDELQALEESVQDQRGKFFKMFPNAGASIRQLRAQPLLFSAEDVYREAADKSDVGDNCGLFCHR